MNLDVVVAIAETVGAVAVVISLAYVGVQIRQNTITQTAQMHQQLVEAQNETNRAIIDNPELSELVNNANEDFDSLSAGDVNRLTFYYFNYFNLWQIAFANTQRGLLEPYLLKEWDRGYGIVFKTNASGRRIWALTREAYDPEFREHTERIIEMVEQDAT